MTRTLRYGYDSASPRLASRIDRMAIRRHTHDAYRAALAAEDFSRQVAQEVSPKLAAPRQVVGGIPAKPFGKRA